MRSTHTVAPSKPPTLTILTTTLFTCLILLIGLSVPVLMGMDLPGDMALLQWAISLRNDGLTFTVQLMTFFGSATPALLMCSALSGVELIHHWRLSRARNTPGRGSLPMLIRSAWPLIAFTGMMICNISMRMFITRLAPKVDYLPHLLPELQASFQRYSFPSGHASSVLVTYIALTIIAWRAPKARWWVMAASFMLIIGVGFGRVYLGVHWPSDVLAGYLLGIVWLALALIMSRFSNFSKEH
jgi:membrane-associated phospholipid phosphatase